MLTTHLRICSMCLYIVVLCVVTGQGHAQSGRFQNTQTHIFSAHDLIQIIVTNESNLSRIYQIDADGTMRFPLLGQVHVAGKNASQVKMHLTRLLKDGYIRAPSISVLAWQDGTATPPKKSSAISLPIAAQSAEDFAKYCTLPEHSFYILGAVENPGRYKFPNDMAHILNAVSIGGGFTKNAIKKNFDIIRKIDGAYFRGTYDDSTFGLTPGDIIVVKEK